MSHVCFYPLHNLNWCTYITSRFPYSVNFHIHCLVTTPITWLANLTLSTLLVDTFPITRYFSPLSLTFSKVPVTSSQCSSWLNLCTFIPSLSKLPLNQERFIYQIPYWDPHLLTPLDPIVNSRNPFSSSLTLLFISYLTGTPITSLVFKTILITHSFLYHLTSDFKK